MVQQKSKNSLFSFYKLKWVYFGFIVLWLVWGCSFPVNDYKDELGDGYIFISESNTYQFIYDINDTSNVHAVPCTVIGYEFNDNNIIAKQKSNPDCINKDLSDTLVSYWIIDKKKKERYGPLDSLSYIQKRKELSISSSLNF